MKQHLLRLSRDDRRLRFSGGVSDQFIAMHCDGIDWLHAVVVGFFAEGVLRGVAELQLDPRDPGRAELAITVEAEWQDRGIGTELLNRALTAAGNRSVRTLSMLCLLDNRRIQHIARKFSDRLVVQQDQVEADLVVPRPTQASLWAEAASEGIGLLATWLDQLPLAPRPETAAAERLDPPRSPA